MRINRYMSLLRKAHFPHAYELRAAGGGGGVSKCRPNLQVVLDVNDIAGVFKKFLSDLDEPVTSYTLYAEFIDIAVAAARQDAHRTNTRLCKVDGVPLSLFVGYMVSF